MNRSLLALAAPVLVCASAQIARSQVTQLSARVEPLPSGFLAEPVSVRAHPEGGVVSAIEFRGAAGVPGFVALARVDGDGELLWATRVPTPTAGTFDLDPEGLEVTASGHVAVVFGAQFVDAVHVTMLEPHGTMLWETVLSASVAPNMLRFLGAGSTPAGDLLVATFQQDYGPSGSETVAVRALDRDTGGALWIREDPTLPGHSQKAATFRGGRAYVVHMVATGLRCACLGPAGALIYDTVDSTLDTSSDQLEFATTTSGGELIVSTWEPGGAFGSNVFKRDGAGALLWRADVLTEPNHSHGTATSDGGVLLVNGYPNGSVTRLDASGQFLWQAPKPAGTDAFRYALAGPEGGAVVVGLRSGSSNEGTPTLTAFDANGLPVGGEDFTNPYVVAYGGAVGRDLRGDVWVQMSSATAPEASLVQFGIGDGGAVTTCAAATPNSTGALSRLRASGTDFAAQNNITLIADRLPPRQSVLFLNSMSPGNVPGVGGSLGTLCLGGSIGRFAGPGEVRASDATGLASLEIDLLTLPNGAASVVAMPGETWYFQAWHRDVVGGVAASNLTGAIATTLR